MEGQQVLNGAVMLSKVAMKDSTKHTTIFIVLHKTLRSLLMLLLFLLSATKQMANQVTAHTDLNLFPLALKAEYGYLSICCSFGNQQIAVVSHQGNCLGQYLLLFICRSNSDLACPHMFWIARSMQSDSCYSGKKFAWRNFCSIKSSITFIKFCNINLKSWG